MHNLKRIICFILTVLVINSVFLSSFAYAAYDKSSAQSIYQTLSKDSSEDGPLDSITAKAYSVIDYESGKIIIESETANDRFSIGNLTKLMTLYLAFEALSNGTVTLDDEINVTKNAQDVSLGRERVFLDYGKKEVITVKQAIEAICTANAFDAGYALAEKLGVNEAGFVVMMNDKAAELGLTNTYYVDSTGVATFEDGHYSSANDIATLSYYLVKNYPDVLTYTSVTNGYFEHTSTSQQHTEMISSNDLIRRGFYSACDGLMTGYSDADGYAQAATAVVDDKREIAVVIGTADQSYRAAELKFLMEYAMENYKYTLLDSAGTFVRKINITDGKSLKVKTATGTDFYATINVADVEKVTKDIVLDGEVVAPVENGKKVGEIVYSIDGKEIGRSDLVASESVERAGWLTRLIRKILKWLGIN